ncbi:MAG: hypothetical protein U0835_12890 [Isosphaeraceae bacterium]
MTRMIPRAATVLGLISSVLSQGITQSAGFCANPLEKNSMRTERILQVARIAPPSFAWVNALRSDGLPDRVAGRMMA